MIKIGIIGGIGSGKSFIAKKFGYPVFNADREVSKIYKKNKSCYFKLKKALPRYIYSFPVKKKEITKAILNNKKNLIKINKIVHPLVRKIMKAFFIKNKYKKFVILDVPLLIENKLNKKDYILIYIQAKKKEVNKRLRLRKNYNPFILKKLTKLQLRLETKKKLSNYIIKNNFKKDSVEKSIYIVKKKILKNERNSS